LIKIKGNSRQRPFFDFMEGILTSPAISEVLEDGRHSAIANNDSVAAADFHFCH
jgi:hypothetical protein